MSRQTAQERQTRYLAVCQPEYLNTKILTKLIIIGKKLDMQTNMGYDKLNKTTSGIGIEY